MALLLHQSPQWIEREMDWDWFLWVEAYMKKAQKKD